MVPCGASAIDGAAGHAAVVTDATAAGADAEWGRGAGAITAQTRGLSVGLMPSGAHPDARGDAGAADGIGGHRRTLDSHDCHHDDRNRRTGGAAASPRRD